MIKPICFEGNPCNDRSDWPPGEWDNEPMDRIDFTHAGFPCFIHRGPLGAWCGYVGLPVGHPYYGKGSGDIACEVHGGVTFASSCQHGGHICHIPKEGEPDTLWWIGFDCNHVYQDVVPGMEKFQQEFRQKYPVPDNMKKFFTGSYKDANYAKKETISLAQQLAQIK